MIDWNKGYDFDDVLIIPKYSDFTSRQEPNTSTYICKGIEASHPIIPANMDCIATGQMADVQRTLKGSFIHHRFSGDTIPMNCSYGNPEFFTMGIRVWIEDPDSWKKRVKYLKNETGLTGICIDIAHAHCAPVMQAIEWFKNEFQDDWKIIIGNIASPYAAHEFCVKGVDALKVGIGPGHACTTRRVTGIGVPQLTAIKWCSQVAKDMNVPIIADGGIKSSGDIVKAIAAGASSVMVGSLLAGTPEAGGDYFCQGFSGKTREEISVNMSKNNHIYNPNGGPMSRKYWGQSSEDFQNLWYGGVKPGAVAEGETKLVECTEKAEIVISNLLAGLRSGMTYCGTSSISKLQKEAELIEIYNNTKR